jgi:hypothetical protein
LETEIKVEGGYFLDSVKLYITHISDSLIYFSDEKDASLSESESCFPGRLLLMLNRYFDINCKNSRFSSSLNKLKHIFLLMTTLVIVFKDGYINIGSIEVVGIGSLHTESGLFSYLKESKWVRAKNGWVYNIEQILKIKECTQDEIKQIQRDLALEKYSIAMCNKNQ